MNVTHTIIVVLFMVGLGVIGVLISRGVKTSSDWMVAGQSLGILPLVGTYFATIVSATSIVSYAGYYYFNGWSGWWNCAGTLLTSALAALIYAKRLRRVSKMTLSDYIEDRFGRPHATYAAIIILIGTTILTAAQVIGGATVLQTITGFSKGTCTVFITVVFIVFTAIGGMKAVAWTDTICSMIIIIGVWVMALVLLDKVGGFGAMTEQLYALDPNMLQPFSPSIPPALAFSWLITWGLGNFGAPQFVTRFYSAKNPEDAAKSQGFTGIALIAFYVPLMLIGLCGALLLPGIEKQDMVNLILISTFLNPVVGGIMMAAIMAACISTADSLLLLCGTTFTNDIYCKYIDKQAADTKILKVSRIVTLLVGLGAVSSTFFINDAIMWIQARSVTLISSVTCVLVLAGLLWKRANAQGAMACMVSGLTTAVVWYALNQPFNLMPLVPAIVVGALALVIVSKMTAHPPADKIRIFFPEIQTKTAEE